jgi:pimeloyl-ACP methyl ester carboxylesterase
MTRLSKYFLIFVSFFILLISCDTQSESLQRQLGPDGVIFTTSDDFVLTGRLVGEGNVVVVIPRPLDESQVKLNYLDTFVDEIAETGVRVLTFDFRDSDNSNIPDLRDYTADLLAALDYVQQSSSEPPLIIGSGIGGGLAFQASFERSLLGIVVIAPLDEYGDQKIDIGNMKLTVPSLFLTSEGGNNLDITADLFDLAISPRILEVYRGSDLGISIISGEHSELAKARILDFIQGCTIGF